MPKLTQSEITFINRYPVNSGVKYTGIRYEMTDLQVT